jgi:pyruvate/2-oxoglutarate dehydrogenase complex dihydrolipoamide dehydrogenase (E3) component
MSERFDVVVIGGGTAGLVTASGCARLGRRVALIEREVLGGDCLWTGCVPTKALVASARLAHQMRSASAFGLSPVMPKLDPKSIMDSMREAQRIAGKHDDPEKFRKLGIDVIEGSARLVANNAVEVEVLGSPLTGQPRAAVLHLEAKDIVIATGSRTRIPPIDGLKAAGFIDHVSFLKQNAFPASILILGGGSIGIEFAQMLRRFGAEIIVIEMLDNIVYKEDPDVIARVRQILREEGVEIYTGWSAKSVRTEAGKKIVRIEDKNGESREVRVDEIFVASGRQGNIEDLGLEVAGVKTEKSYVVANKYLETTAARIWACGDVHGRLQFTHVAAYDAVKLVRNILFPGKSAVNYDDIPWALYTDPEVGHIGMTEPEARQAFGGDVRIYSVEMADVDRAVVDRATGGFIKFVCDRKGRILGAHAMCTNASTLIEEIVLARKKGVKIGALAQLVSPYPSLADAVQKAAASYYQGLSGSRIGALARRIAAWSQ